MKLRHLVSSTTPASLQNWLEEELESRGIDGVYTRYILSLLQNDPLADLANNIECAHFETLHNYGQTNGLAVSKSRHRRWKSLDHGKPYNLIDTTSKSGLSNNCNCSNPLCFDMEECKKSVAVECLKSASEEKNGIEKLIDEVCTKLKNLKADCESPKCLSLPADSGVLLRSLTLSEPFPPGKHMEMYYSAFPALNGKSVSCVKDDLQDEGLFIWRNDEDEADGVKGGAWCQKDLVFNPTKDLNDESEKENQPEENVPRVFYGVPKTKTENWTAGLISRCDDSTVLTSDANLPTFIVPKMAAHKVPSVAMFAPFTSATCQLNISKVVAIDEKEDCELEDHLGLLQSLDNHQLIDDGVAIDDGEDNWNGSQTNSLPPSQKSTPIKNGEDTILVTDLASKFNSALAAIWGPEGTGEENNAVKSDPGVELSFKIYSMPAGISKTNVTVSNRPKSPEPVHQGDSPPGNVNFFIGSCAEIGSVWSTNIEDVKALAGKESVPPGVTLSTGTDNLIAISPTVSDFLQSATREVVSRGSEKIFSASCSEDLENNIESKIKPEMTNQKLSLEDPFIRQLLRDGYYFSENDCNSKSRQNGEPLVVELIKHNFFFDESECDSHSNSNGDDLCLSPEMFFRETENDCALSSTEGTELEYASQLEPSILTLVQSSNPKSGIYNLWNTPSPSLSGHLVLPESQTDSIWPTSDPTEKVAQWISKQFEGGQTSWNKGTPTFTKDFPVAEPPILKENCTITYHKGESRFMEVLPSVKKTGLALILSESDASPVELISPCSSNSITGKAEYKFRASENVLANFSLSDGANEDDDDDDDDEEEEEENLLTSHKTHFTPIRQESSETESSICDYEAVVVALEQSTTTFLKSKVKDGGEISCELEEHKSTPSTTLEEMLLLSAPLSLEDLERSKSPETNDLMMTIQSGWRTSQYRDKSTSTEMGIGAVCHVVGDGRTPLETIVEPPVRCEYNSPVDPMGFSAFRKMRIWSSDSLENLELELGTEVALPPHQIPWKWSTTDDGDENEERNTDLDLAWRLDNITPVTDQSKDDTVCFLKSDSSRPVSPQITEQSEQECDLDALRRELEAEEEQLFRDINLASDSEDYTCAGLLRLDTMSKSKSPEQLLTTCCAKDFFAFGGYKNNKWSSGESDFSSKTDQPLSNDFSEANSCSTENALPAIPTEKVLYSSQLEEEWHKSSQPFNIQVPRKIRAKSRSSPQRRPCTFYLEGNCRRSDCKFSHDLSSITCRFWEEGSCFKGITCPFLHGYLSEEALRQKFGNKCKFALESEADFPSLSNSTQSTPLTNSKDVKGAQKEVFAGRILRPKKKKLLAGTNKTLSSLHQSTVNTTDDSQTNSTSGSDITPPQSIASFLLDLNEPPP